MNAHLRSTVLVGRAAERRLLDAAAAEVAAGGVATVLVGGDAGIGKSRLVEEVTAGLAGTVLTGGCVELGADGLPFAPFVAALRGIAGDLQPAERDRLAPLLPGLAAAGPRDEQSRPRLFEGVLALLTRLAAERPLTLVLEDAHWADRSSIDLLDFLVRNQRAAPGSLVLLTHRSDEPGARGLRPLLTGLGGLGWVRTVRLGPLSRAEVAAQATAILRRPADPALVTAVHRRSDGNPLFVEALLDGGDQSGGGPGVPDSLADLLAARVERLGPEVGAVLRAAAVGGLRTAHRVLAEVCGAFAPAGIDEQARAAVEAGVLVVDGEGYRFRHALIRDAVLAGVLPGERANLHRRYARAFRSGGGNAELSHHLTGAGDGPGAVAAAWAAALATRRSLAYAEELELLERVLGWWDSVPATPELVGADRASVLERAAEAAVRAGEHGRAEELVTAALAEPVAAREGVRTAALLELRARARVRGGRPGAGDDLRAALAAVPDPHAIRPYLLNALAAYLMDVPDPDGARAAAEQALAAVGSGDDPAAAGALITLATLDARLGDLDAQLPRLRRAAAIARAIDAQQLGLRALDRHAHLLLGFGRFDEAERVAREGLALAAAAGLARSSGAAHGVNLAAARAGAGRWDAAVESIEHTLDLVPPRHDQARLLTLRADIELHRGRPDTAAQLLDAAGQLVADDPGQAPTLVQLPRLRVRHLLASGRPGEAAALGAAALAVPDLAVMSRYSWPLLMATAEAAVAAGDTDAVAAVRDAMAAMPARTDPQAAAAAATAALLDPTPQAWTAAVEAWERVGQPLELAQALHGLGAALLAAGADRERAAAALRRAAELAAGLGARPLHADVVDLTRRARLPLGGHPAGTVAELPDRLGLTPRETEVLALVARGMANADIAERLFISTKTASVHVSNILGKLEVGNRVEAAAVAHRLGLAGELSDEESG